MAQMIMLDPQYPFHAEFYLLPSGQRFTLPNGQVQIVLCSCCYQHFKQIIIPPNIMISGNSVFFVMIFVVYLIFHIVLND